jgi:hypothetical protein
LVRVVATDSNVLNVTFAAKCLEAFASGLRADFSQFASTVLGALLEKCKEKKKSVIDALVAAADAVIKTTSLEKVHVSWCSSSPSFVLRRLHFLLLEFHVFLSPAFYQCRLHFLGHYVSANRPQPQMFSSCV